MASPWMHDATVLPLPTLSVALRDVSLTVERPVAHHEARHVFQALGGLFRKAATEPLDVVRDVNLDLRPGTATLILGAPGSGKTTLLKLIAGHSSSVTRGKVTFNGLSAAEFGPSLSKLAKLVKAEHKHMALLTVKETLQLAEQFQSAHTKSNIESVIRTLQLENCQDTVVGNEFVRGISGGEMQRLTLAEMLMGNPRLLALDEYSTGLDSSTALAITTALKQWAVDTNGTVVASLLQPIPEMLEQFDQLVLLQSGRVVFAGPREAALPFLEVQLGVECPPDRDYADFMVSYLGDPGNTLRAAHEARTHAQHESKAQEIAPVATPPTADALASVFRKDQKLDDVKLIKNPQSEFSTRQYGEGHHLGFFAQTKLLLHRQARNYYRDKDTLVGPWVFQGIFLGLVMGSLFWSLNLEDFGIKATLLLFLSTILFGFNLTELPIASLAKNVVEKQVDAAMYSPFAFVVAAAVVHIPFALANLFTIGTIVYWMSGLSAAFEDYLIYCLLFFAVDLSLSAAFRAITFLSPSLTVAEVMAPMGVVVVFIFSGAVISESNLEPWVIWLLYVSPLAWFIRAILINEATGSAYEGVVNADGVNLGIASLEDFDYRTDRIWIWMGLVYLLAFYFLALALSGFVLKKLRYKSVTGTSRTSDAASSSTELVEVAVQGDHGLPFQPLALSFSELSYTVPIAKTKTTAAHDKVLLTNIRGSAMPGRMVALMGASGAGKTTLLDVLADRKSTGTIGGHILVGGKPRSEVNYRRLVGYVQQQDAHIETATVQEALWFSANLRLPKGATKAQRLDMVTHTLEVLELSAQADWLVSTLSAGQAKRLTMGVELVANPSILFLDEPTTGLDSRAALSVLRVVRNVCRTGRTVICTIHQPSAELFFKFDDLLLLQRGGTETYCGPIGERGVAVAEYFAPISSFPLPPRTNVATWIVEVVAQGDADGSSKAFSGKFDASPASKEAEERVAAAAKAVTLSTDSNEANFPGNVAAFKTVFKRSWTSHARALDYNVSRLVSMPVLSVMFGLVFFDLSVTDLDDVQSALGAVMLLSGFNAVILMQTAGPHVFTMRNAFYRETASKTYSSFLFALSFILIEFIWVLPLMAVSTAISYTMIGFDSDVGRFFQFYAVVAAICVASSLNGYAWGVLTSNHQSLQIAVGGTQNLFWLFNGFFVSGSRIPIGWKWLFTILPYDHTLDPLTTSQFHGDPTVIELPSGASVNVEQYLLDEYDYDYDNRWREFGILFVYIAFWSILFLLGARFVRHLK